MKGLTRLGLLLATVLMLASCRGNAGSSGGGQDGGMQGMDHGEIGSGDMSSMSRKMVMPNGEYSDAAFVDAMVPHHERAVEMARSAEASE